MADQKAKTLNREVKEDKESDSIPRHPGLMDLTEPQIRQQVKEKIETYIPYEKFKQKLCEEFNHYQQITFKSIGYNLEYFTPFECLEAFKDSWWRQSTRDKIFAKCNNFVNQ